MSVLKWSRFAVPRVAFALSVGFLVAHTLFSSSHVSGSDQLSPELGRAHVSGIARVVDGDTLDLAGRRIRLEGIDAPEAGQTCPGRYVGGILEMCDVRLYRFWSDLGEAMQTGKPQNEIKHTGEPLFAKLYSDPQRLRQFMGAMQGYSLAAFEELAEAFDFSPYATVCDVGGATGQLACRMVGKFKQRHEA